MLVHATNLLGRIKPPGIGFTSCISGLRRKMTSRLKEECNLIVGPQDLIANDRRHGYCFMEWISVRATPD